MFEKREKRKEQEELWIVKKELKPGPAEGFYRRVDETLEKMHFGEKVHAMCAAAYADRDKGGRPGIDPVVYYKMLLVGFFEGLRSEREIAARCDDSRSIRVFLGYELTEATPDHSSLTVIRQRLGVEIYQKVFEVVLEALREHGLLKGKNLGIDSSVIEANASLRTLVDRNTEQAYWEYVKGLAKEAGINPDDAAAVRSFDRKRKGRKTSNREWKNPHDEDSRIGQTKDGATDMIYRPEHVSDLDTGVIVQAEVRLGDQADQAGLAERVLEAASTLQEIIRPEHRVKTVVGDKGYFGLEELGVLQEVEIKTVVSDPHRAKRRVKKLALEQRTAWRRAQRSVQSGYGKNLLRRRGMHVERSFEHVLDAGGMRVATLRGQVNLNKRHKFAAACFNLSQLLRKLYRVGTLKQWVATALLACERVIGQLLHSDKLFLALHQTIENHFIDKIRQTFFARLNPCFSTVS
jgi:transposase